MDKVAALALTVVLAASPATAQDIEKVPSILVAGHGDVETDPDRVSITYSLRGEGRTSDAAVRAMVDMGSRITRELRSIDASIDPRTGDLSTNPVRSSDCKEQEYGSKLLSVGPCAITGFVATQIITAETASVNDAGTLVGLASRNGAEDAGIGSFFLSEQVLAKAKSDALTDAFHDAASSARRLAAAGSLRLGPVLLATNGDRNALMASAMEVKLQQLPQVYAEDLMNAPPVRVVMSAKKIKTVADVTVRYAIQR